MEYRFLGRSSVQVSSLCLGCMNFGNRTAEDESIRIIHEAIDNGINFVDTANVYQRGVSETIVGKALAGARRDNVVLATKASSRMGDGPNDQRSSRYHLMRQVDDSLRRLQTDHIDLYQLHVMDMVTPAGRIDGNAERPRPPGEDPLLRREQVGPGVDGRSGHAVQSSRMGHDSHRTAALQSARPSDRERADLDVPASWNRDHPVGADRHRHSQRKVRKG